jgi:hypothetical protein
MYHVAHCVTSRIVSRSTATPAASAAVSGTSGVNEHAARRETESLRELIAAIRDELAEYLSPELRNAIDKALR